MLQAKSLQLKIFKVLLLTEEFERVVLNRETNVMRISIFEYHFLKWVHYLRNIPAQGHII